MDEECTVLTSYLPERQRAEGVPSGEALIGLYARRRTATSILLRGIEGSGRQQPRVGRSLPQAAESALTAIAVDTRPDIEAVLDETLRLARPRLVTIERARLLSGEIEPGPARRGARGCHQADRVLPAAGSRPPDTGLRSGLRAAVPPADRRRHRAVRRRRRRPRARPATARPVPPPRRRRSSHGGRRRRRRPDRDAASRARRHVPPPADDDREGPAVQAGRAVRQPTRDRPGPGRRRGGHDGAVQIDGLHLRGRAP